jgi:serralysin
MGNGDQSSETFYSQLDLWRFTGLHTRLFDGSTTTAPLAYFSLDGGATMRAEWGELSDPSDFRGPNSFPPSFLTPNDPFNEDYMNGTLDRLTETDTLLMNALGFRTG